MAFKELENIKNINDLKKYEKLIIKYNDQTEFKLELEELILNYNQITSLENVVFPDGLQILDLNVNKITSLKNAVFSNSLQKLILNNNKITSLENVVFPDGLLELFLYDNQITSLENVVFPDGLQKLNLSNNRIISLENVVFSNSLQELDLSHNQITSLKNAVFPNGLQELYLSHNQITSLKNAVFSNGLQVLYLYYNQITSLENAVFPDGLQKLILNRNQITSLENIVFPVSLQNLYLYSNQLTSLPISLITLRNLYYINYENNPIENISGALLRFLNRVKNRRNDDIQVYNDAQSVHNTSIQSSFRDSTLNLLKDTITKEFEDNILNAILENEILNSTTKKAIIEYYNDETIHSLLNITFKDVLIYVFNRIFKSDFKNDILNILNAEMNDSLCMCFTGRLTRLVNCLNGYYDDITLKINDSEQLSNIIVVTKKVLEENKEYTVEKHKELAFKEMTERGYDKDTIEVWLSYIEE